MEVSYRVSEVVRMMGLLGYLLRRKCIKTAFNFRMLEGTLGKVKIGSV